MCSLHWCLRRYYTYSQQVGVRLPKKKKEKQTDSNESIISFIFRMWAELGKCM